MSIGYPPDIVSIAEKYRPVLKKLAEDNQGKRTDLTSDKILSNVDKPVHTRDELAKIKQSGSLLFFERVKGMFGDFAKGCFGNTFKKKSTPWRVLINNLLILTISN